MARLNDPETRLEPLITRFLITCTFPSPPSDEDLAHHWERGAIRDAMVEFGAVDGVGTFCLPLDITMRLDGCKYVVECAYKPT